MIKCVICEDKGFLLKKVLYDVDGKKIILRDNAESYDEEVWIPCECRKKIDNERILDYKLTEAGIPKPLRKYTFEDYLKIPFLPDTKRANKNKVDIIQQILNDPSVFLDHYNVLWIWGPDQNSGHTTLAVIIGIKFIELGYNVRFLRMQELIDAFVNWKEKEEYFKKLNNFQIYIIDDAFDTYSTTLPKNYSLAHIFQFLDESVLLGKNFIMVSNTEVQNIPAEFSRSATVISRSCLSLELRGKIPIKINEVQ